MVCVGYNILHSEKQEACGKVKPARTDGHEETKLNLSDHFSCLDMLIRR